MRFIPLACLALTAATGLHGQHVHVSPAGNDQNAGTREEPFASIGKALAVTRDAGQGTIWLGEGDYYVGDGITLDTSSSRADGEGIVIRSEGTHKAKITGARRVSSFEPIASSDAERLISEDARKHVLVADLKAQGFPALGKMPDKFRAPGVEEVIFGDMPMQSARWPNEGFTHFTEVIDAGASDPIHWVTREVYRPGSFKFLNDRAKHWDITRGVYLHGFWCYEWADEALKVASYDAETRELRFAVKHGYGIGNPRRKNSKRQFYALNVFEELDQPGEYYLDRGANKLYFWPPNDITNTPVFVSLRRGPLVTATGVSNLVLQDLVLENGCGWAVQLKGCTSSRVDNCLVRNMGLGGIRCSGGTDNHVIGCEITRTGSRAVAMSAGDRKSLTPGKCSVVGNHLHHLGR